MQRRIDVLFIPSQPQTSSLEILGLLGIFAESPVILESFEVHKPLLSSESSVGAHLMALNKLRQELIANHPQDINARKRVEAVIQQGLQLLEASR